MEETKIEMGMFFVVQDMGEDIEQITTALDTYEAAKDYRDGNFCKKRWPNAYIIATVKEVASHKVNE
jgi:hypothetical protein